MGEVWFSVAGHGGARNVVLENTLESGEFWDYGYFDAHLSDSWLSNLNDPAIPWVQSTARHPHICDVIFFLLDVPNNRRLVSRLQIPGWP